MQLLALTAAEACGLFTPSLFQPGSLIPHPVPENTAVGGEYVTGRGMGLGLAPRRTDYNILYNGTTPPLCPLLPVRPKQRTKASLTTQTHSHTVAG